MAASTAPPGQRGALSREQQDRVTELRTQQSKLGKTDPVRAELQAKITAIYQEAFDRGNAAVPAPAARDASPTIAERINTLSEKAVGMSKTDPARPGAIADLTAAYAEKSAAEAGGGGAAAPAAAADNGAAR